MRISSRFLVCNLIVAHDVIPNAADCGKILYLTNKTQKVTRESIQRTNKIPMTAPVIM